MIYISVDNDTANLWWDSRVEFTDGCFYKITINDGSCVYTKDFVYFVKNLQPDTEYKFTLEVINDKGETLGKKEKKICRTLPEYKYVDISAAPYFAVGDGKTDVTEIINKAIVALKDGECLYIPEGVFVCKRLQIDNNLCIRFNAGASIVSEKVFL